MKTACKARGRRVWGAFVLSMSSWILVGCGGGGSNATSAATTASTNTAQEAADYVALHEGDRLVYAVQHPAREFVDTTSVQVLAPSTDDGLTGATIESIFETEFERSQTSYFLGIGSKGLIAKYPPPNGATWIFNAWRSLPSQFKIGDKFTPGINNGVDQSESTEATIVGIETVTTPAGQFANCIKTIAIRKYPQTDTSAASHDTYITWFAPGIGRVKDENYNSDGVLYSKSSLIAFQVNGVRSETVRPVATLTAAPSEATHGRFDAVSLQFSEPMWPGAMSQSVALVTDPTGAMIPGDISFTENSWTFKPKYGELRVSGTYKVQLTEVATDRAGNVVMPGSWLFAVDATPPAATGTQFTDGKIFITFNEDLMSPEGFGGAYLVGTLGDTVPIDTGDVSFERNRVVLDIAAYKAYLTYNGQYKVVIAGGSRNGLSDLAGNFTDDFIATITLPPGPF